MTADIYISDERGDVTPLSSVINGRCGGVIVRDQGPSRALLVDIGHGEFLIVTADSEIGGKSLYDIQEEGSVDMARLPKAKWRMPLLNFDRCVLSVRRHLNDTTFLLGDISRELFTLWLFRVSFVLEERELLNVRQLCRKYGYSVRLAGRNRVRLTRRSISKARIRGIRLMSCHINDISLVSHVDGCQYQGIRF